MECEFYSGSVNALIDWCRSPENLQRYRDHIAAECEQLADISLLRHLRTLLQLLQDLQVHGFQSMLEQQRGAVDAMFTDMLASATWHGWAVPLARDGQGSLPLEVQQRGLFGADEASNVAMLFVVDSNRIAICRQREADTQARHPHDQSCPP